MSKNQFWRKNSGQHFLIDKFFINLIIQTISPRENDCIIEIGPGLSALTKPLLRHLKHLIAIEIDKKLVEKLHKSFSKEDLTIIRDDVLKVDFRQFGKSIRVMGNLPYKISSPILFHLMPAIHLIHDQHFMLQRELVNRMVAKPSNPDYGRLSIMVQSYYQISKIFEVPPEAFNPPPKVFSAFVRMIPRSANSYSKPRNFTIFKMLVTKSFSQKRKMLRQSLSHLTTHIPWEKLGIASTARPGEISVEQFINLSNSIEKIPTIMQIIRSGINFN